MNLTGENVNKTFLKCLYQDGESAAGATIVEGILGKFGLNPGRLKEHEQDITDMLNELPKDFHEKTGGGMSFLNACNTKKGALWTGEHRTMEELVVMGIGIGRVKYCLPKDFWKSLPGGMPYFMVLENPK